MTLRLTHYEDIARMTTRPQISQRLGLDLDGRTLSDDNIVGPRTRGGTYLDVQSVQHPLVKTAVHEILLGAQEIGGNNKGAFVYKYTQVAGKYGQPWCAAFTSWCLRQVDKGSPVSGGARVLGARVAKVGGKFYDWTHVEPGDLLIFSRGKAAWKGHIGIVVDWYNGGVLYIDGNTGAFPSPVRMRFLASPDRSTRSKLLYIARPPSACYQ